MRSNIRCKCITLMTAVCLCLAAAESGRAQNIVQDTLHVSFEYRAPEPCPGVRISSVKDKRDRAGAFIGIYETTKYMFVPVDLLIRLPGHLDEEISAMFVRGDTCKESEELCLAVKHLRVSSARGPLFTTRYRINATLGISRICGTDTVSMGDLVYEVPYDSPFFGCSLKQGIEHALSAWQEAVIHDIHLVGGQNSLQKQMQGPVPLRPAAGERAYMNLAGSGEVSAGSQWSLFDVHVYFTDREPSSWFYRNGGHHLRYRHENEFDSIEFGLSMNQWNYRLSRCLLLRVRYDLMFGFNKWKDIQDTEHTLYDALIFEACASQLVQYHPLDSKGLVLGAGLLQGVNYITSKGTRFQYGICIQLGVIL